MHHSWPERRIHDVGKDHDGDNDLHDGDTGDERGIKMTMMTMPTAMTTSMMVHSAPRLRILWALSSTEPAGIMICLSLLCHCRFIVIIIDINIISIIITLALHPKSFAKYATPKPWFPSVAVTSNKLGLTRAFTSSKLWKMMRMA